MCKVLEKNIHWCWRYASGRTKFSNIMSIWANKNGNKSTIVNLIQMALHRIHGIFIRTDKSQTDRRTAGRTEPKLLSPIKIVFLVGDNYVLSYYVVIWVYICMWYKLGAFDVIQIVYISIYNLYTIVSWYIIYVQVNHQLSPVWSILDNFFYKTIHQIIFNT